MRPSRPIEWRGGYATRACTACARAPTMVQRDGGLQRRAETTDSIKRERMNRRYPENRMEAAWDVYAGLPPGSEEGRIVQPQVKRLLGE